MNSHSDFNPIMSSQCNSASDPPPDAVRALPALGLTPLTFPPRPSPGPEGTAVRYPEGNRLPEERAEGESTGDAFTSGRRPRCPQSRGWRRAGGALGRAGAEPPPLGHHGRHRAPPPCAPRSRALPEVGRGAPQEAEVRRSSLRRRSGRQGSPLVPVRMRTRQEGGVECRAHAHSARRIVLGAGCPAAGWAGSAHAWVMERLGERWAAWWAERSALRPAAEARRFPSRYLKKELSVAEVVLAGSWNGISAVTKVTEWRCTRLLREKPELLCSCGPEIPEHSPATACQAASASPAPGSWARGASVSTSSAPLKPSKPLCNLPLWKWDTKQLT